MILSILAFTGLSLLLHFEISAIQEKKRAGDLYGAQLVRSRFEGRSSISVRSDDHDYNNANRGNDHERKDLILIRDERHANDVLVSARELGNEKKSFCPEIEEKPRFREVGKGTLVYSVWFDDRKTQNFIRILLVGLTRNPLPSLTCHFKSSSKRNTFTSGASLYQHNENHQMRFGSFIASCAVPQDLDSVPCFVNITTTLTAHVTVEKLNDSISMVFPVGFIHRQPTIEKTSRGKYGICIPPVYGDISVGRVIEFLELSQILGASHFTFYDLAMPVSVRNALKYYQKIGLVSVLPWNLPPYIGRHDLHYFGQTLTIMECLYRSMKHLHFVAFNDLDEFIVPLRHENMGALLENIHRKDHCGHCFDSVLFDPSTEQDTVRNSRLLTQRVFHRTSQATPFWSKCVVDPRKIFEQGIHHISKPIEEYYHAEKVNWDTARVFHYRKCQDSRALMQPRCSGLIVDKTMQKFGDQLLRKVENRMSALADRKPLK